MPENLLQILIFACFYTLILSFPEALCNAWGVFAKKTK